MHFKPIFDHGHFVALLTVQVLDIVGAANGHDAHAVSARIGFDNEEWLVGDAVFFVLLGDFFEHRFDRVRQFILTCSVVEVDVARMCMVRVD